MARALSLYGYVKRKTNFILSYAEDDPVPPEELFSALLIALSLQSIIRYARRHVTPDAIKETVDLLPLSICISNVQGDVLLTNLFMNRISAALTGRPLVDTHALWQAVTVQGEEQEGRYLTRTPEGMALLFSRDPVLVQGVTYTQYTAVDVTEQMQITDSLRERNEKLLAVQRRMKSLHARTMEMLLPEEILKARVQVHDRLGHLLLLGRAFLDDPEHQNGEALIRMMKELGNVLRADVAERQPDGDIYADTLSQVERLGVRLEITGPVPPAGAARDLLGHALAECAANAVKHAEGDCVWLRIALKDGWITAVFTNNGNPPQGTIQEMGGLLSLRRMAEGMGGGMTVESAPAFRLTLKLPETQGEKRM